MWRCRNKALQWYFYLFTNLLTYLTRRTEKQHNRVQACDWRQHEKALTFVSRKIIFRYDYWSTQMIWKWNTTQTFDGEPGGRLLVVGLTCVSPGVLERHAKNHQPERALVVDVEVVLVSVEDLEVVLEPAQLGVRVGIAARERHLVVLLDARLVRHFLDPRVLCTDVWRGSNKPHKTNLQRIKLTPFERTRKRKETSRNTATWQLGLLDYK